MEHQHGGVLADWPVCSQARPHAPWRGPQRFWDMYETEKVSMPEHRLPPEDMPGIAWKQNGFYNATDSSLIIPDITVPLSPLDTKSMRHAYFAAVSWLDFNIGTVCWPRTGSHAARQAAGAVPR